MANWDKFKEYFEPGDWAKLQKEIKYRYDLIKNEGLPNSADYAELYLKNLSNAENPYWFLITATSMVKPITADGAYWYNVGKNLGKKGSEINETFLKMQKLAGIITEGQYKKKINEEAGEPNFTYHDPELGDPSTANPFKFKDQPANPNAMLTMYDGDDEVEDTFTKQDWWESDVIDRDPQDITPIFATKEGGVWEFGFDDGSSLSGFVEGEDFTFGSK